MVTKQDIANIRLIVKDMAVLCNKDDATSVDIAICSRVAEVLQFYKGSFMIQFCCINQQLPSLTQVAFLLAIQTEFQKQLSESMHKKYYVLTPCMGLMHTLHRYGC